MWTAFKLFLSSKALAFAVKRASPMFKRLARMLRSRL